MWRCFDRGARCDFICLWWNGTLDCRGISVGCLVLVISLCIRVRGSIFGGRRVLNFIPGVLGGCFVVNSTVYAAERLGNEVCTILYSVRGVKEFRGS